VATELTYYIFEGLLVGQANDKFLHIFAGSGGGSGSTTNKPVGWVANSVYAQGIVTKAQAPAWRPDSRRRLQNRRALCP
jgi:hypothetical protein